MSNAISIIPPSYLSSSEPGDEKSGISFQSISTRVTCCNGKQDSTASVKDCNSYYWKSFDKLTPEDNVEYGDYDIHSAKQLAICRLNMNGEIVVGKGIMEFKSCLIPYDGNELWFRDTHNFEVLTNPKSVNFTWVQNDKGSDLPPGAVPGGSDISETTYVARCKWKSTYGDESAPGTLYKGAMTFAYGGKARDCDTFEIMTCV